MIQSSHSIESPARRTRSECTKFAIARWVGPAIAISLAGGCALRVPEPLTNPDPEAALRVNAGAHDGCAFAGTWELGDDRPGKSRHDFNADRGIVVFEVTERRIRGAVLPVLRDWHGNRILPSKFTIIEGVIGPDGRIASGTREQPYFDAGVEATPVELALADDGLTFRSAYLNSPSPREEAQAGRKLRAGPCGIAVQFVSDAFDTTRNGKPLPETYTGFSWENLLSIGMPARL